MRNGKSNISIQEKARRVYSAHKDRKPFPSQEEENPCGEEQDEYNPYIDINQTDEQSIATSRSSDYLYASQSPILGGLRMDLDSGDFEFEDENLFEGFRPIFEHPPPVPCAPDESDVGASEMKLATAKLSKPVKVSMDAVQSVDLIF
jgi:hypothetical protein